MGAHPEVIPSKPKLRLRDRPVDYLQSPFAKALREVVRARRMQKALEKDPTNRLSAQALFAEVLALSGTSEKRIRELKAAIENGAAGFMESKRTLRMAATAFTSGHWSTAPRNVQALSRYDTLVGKVTREELAAKHYMPVDLVAAAILIAAKEAPDKFGRMKSSADIDAGYSEAKRRFEQLCEKAMSVLDHNIDLEESESDRHGACVYWFRLSNRQVTLHKRETAMERLADHLLNVEG